MAQGRELSTPSTPINVQAPLAHLTFTFAIQFWKYTHVGPRNQALDGWRPCHPEETLSRVFGPPYSIVKHTISGVGQYGEPCKKGRTHRDVVRRTDLRGSGKPLLDRSALGAT